MDPFNPPRPSAPPAAVLREPPRASIPIDLTLDAAPDSLAPDSPELVPTLDGVTVDNLAPAAALQGLKAQQEKLALDIAAIDRVRVLMGDDSVVLPDKRPSLAVTAAKKTALATRIGMAVLGGFVLAGEWVASNYPHTLGPLSALFKIALRMLGWEATTGDTP